MTEPDMSRRQVLCGLVIGVLAPGMLAACGTAGPVRQGGPGDAKPGSTLAKVGDIPVGGGVIANAGMTGLLLVVQPTAGEFLAYNPTCPHLGVTVDPPEQGIITCPGHGSQFDPANGALRRGPAQRGLASVAVLVRAGNVVLA